FMVSPPSVQSRACRCAPPGDVSVPTERMVVPAGIAPGGLELGQRLSEGRGTIRHSNRRLLPWHGNSRHPAINDRPGVVLSALPLVMVHPRQGGNLRLDGVLEALYGVEGGRPCESRLDG